MKKKIAFFVGSHIPASTQTLFTNLTKLISDDFEIDFVGFYGEEKFGDEFEFDVNEFIYDYPSQKSPKRLWYSSESLNRYLDDNDPDIIVLPHKFGVYGAPFFLTGHLHRTIIRLNDDTFKMYKDELYETKLNRLKAFIVNNLLSKIILKKALGIIVQTDYMYEECKKRGLDPEKIEVLPLPIETDKFGRVNERRKKEIRKRLDLEGDKTVGILVGGKSRKKRRHLLAELLDKTDALDDMTFMIVGNTEYGKKLSRRYPNVRYEGFIDHDDLPRYYQAADFFLHFAEREGLPTVFQEATACGLPIIAKKANYNQEMDICKFETVEELEKILRKESWKNIETYVTPGLPKEEYIQFFKKMIDRASD